MSRERWFTLVVAGSVDEDLRLDGAPNIDEFIEDFFGELIREAVEDQPIRVGDVKITEAFWTEDAPATLRFPSDYFSGVIESAAWQAEPKESSLQRRPYILLAIRTREHVPRILYKAMPIVIPLLPGMISPITQLTAVAGQELMVPASGSIKIGEQIPELIGREVMFRIEEVMMQGKFRPHVTSLRPLEKS